MAGAGVAARPFTVRLADGRRVALLYLETEPAEVGWPTFVPPSEGR